MPEPTEEKQRKGRFRPGQSGNPSGRPKGSRGKATSIAEGLLRGEAGELTRKLIEKAKAGDIDALKFCLSRLVSPMKDRTIAFTLPEIKGAADIPEAFAAILRAVSEGTISPGEASSLGSTLEAYRRGLELSEIETRVQTLEERLNGTENAASKN